MNSNNSNVSILTGQNVFPMSFFIRDQYERIFLGTGKHLTELYLMDGFLTELPSEIGFLTKLTILNVSRNALLTLPSSLSQLKELVQLNVSQNHLKSTTLLDVFKTTSSLLTTLKVLDIRDNLIQVVPNTIPKKMPFLKKLFINGNMIASDQIKAISDACQVQECQVDFVETMQVPQVEKTQEKPQQQQKQVQMDVLEIESSSDSNSSTPHNHGQGSCYTGTDILDMEVDQAGTTKNTLAAVNAELQEHKSTEDEDTEELDQEEEEKEEEEEKGEEEEEQEEEMLYEEERLKSSFVRLQEYIQKTECERYEVKRLRPRLWRSFVQDNVPFLTSLGSCVLCCDTSARTQRFNSMVLCTSCIRLALDILEQEAKTSKV
jgi:hypothetical protein